MFALAVMAGSAFAAPQSCEALAKVKLPTATVTSAAMVEAGAFTPPAGMPAWLVGDPSFYNTIPAFCRVQNTDKPSTDADIKIGVWLPANGWNGKIRGQGSGGFAGMIDYRSLALAVLQG